MKFQSKIGNFYFIFIENWKHKYILFKSEIFCTKNCEKIQKSNKNHANIGNDMHFSFSLWWIFIANSDVPVLQFPVFGRSRSSPFIYKKMQYQVTKLYIITHYKQKSFRFISQSMIRTRGRISFGYGYRHKF